MRHFQDVMNAEKWNHNVNNRSHENDEKENTVRSDDYNEISVEGHSSNSTISKELDSINKDISTNISQLETSKLESIVDMESPIRQTVRKPTPLAKTDEIYFEQQKTSSTGAFKTKKRVRKSGRLWMFILAGLLISSVSGAAMAYWFSNRDSKLEINSQATFIEESEPVYNDNTNTLFNGEDEGNIPDDHDVTMGDESDISDDGLYVDIADDDLILDDTEYAEEDIKDFAFEESSFSNNIVVESDLSSKLVTHREFGIITIKKKPAIDNKIEAAVQDSSLKKDSEEESTLVINPDLSNGTSDMTIKEESAADEKIAAAVSAIRKNILGQEKEVHKEVTERPVALKPAKKTKQPSLIKAASVNVEKKQTETVKPVSKQTAAKKKTSEMKKVINDTSAQTINASAQKADNNIIQKINVIPDALEDNKQEIDNAEPVAISSKETLQSDPVLARESVKEAVIIGSFQEKTSSSNRDDNTLQIGIPIANKTVMAASIQEKTVFNKKNVKALLITKPPVTDPVITASKQEKNLTTNADVKALQTGISSILKEMSVNYEDQFSSNNNNWPEYEKENFTAVIAKGEYHIENRARLGTHALLHPDGVPIDMDLMINVSIGSVRSSGENSYGFVFGAKDTRNNYSFLVKNGHMYSIEKMSEGISKKIKGGQIDNIFISGDDQKSMKIVKRKNIVRFYIDGHLIDEIADFDYFGDKIGFLVRGKVRMSVDRTQTQIRFQK